MKNSPSSTTVSKTIARIRALLDEDHIRSEIDTPIDRALDGFKFDAATPVSRHRFHEIIAAFVRHVYQYGLRTPRRLAPATALAEALDIIERSYPAPNGDRYDAALCDALSREQDGLILVLDVIAAEIAERERQKYASWVIASSFSLTDWRARCAIAEALLAEHAGNLTPELQQLTPAQLADNCLDLIFLDGMRDQWRSPVFAWFGL